MKTTEENNYQFVLALEKAIDFHSTNKHDPHGVSNAVICALMEVKNAFMKSHCMRKKKKGRKGGY